MRSPFLASMAIFSRENVSVKNGGRCRGDIVRVWRHFFRYFADFLKVAFFIVMVCYNIGSTVRFCLLVFGIAAGRGSFSEHQLVAMGNGKEGRAAQAGPPKARPAAESTGGGGIPTRR